MPTRFYSQDGRLVFNTNEYADWPKPGTPEWDNLDVRVTNLSSTKPIGVSLSGDGVLTFTATDPKDSFHVEFELKSPRTPRAPEQRSRSMRLKDKNRQRAKAKMAKVSRKRNRT